MLLAGGGGPLLTGMLAWWIKGMLTDIRKIGRLERAVVNLQSTIESQSGELKSMTNLIYQNQKDLAVIERDQQSQWKRYDDLSRRVRELKL